jgi:hypothetical protein
MIIGKKGIPKKLHHLSIIRLYKVSVPIITSRNFDVVLVVNSISLLPVCIFKFYLKVNFYIYRLMQDKTNYQDTCAVKSESEVS